MDSHRKPKPQAASGVPGGRALGEEGSTGSLLGDLLGSIAITGLGLVVAAGVQLFAAPTDVSAAPATDSGTAGIIGRERGPGAAYQALPDRETLNTGSALSRGEQAPAAVNEVPVGSQGSSSSQEGHSSPDAGALDRFGADSFHHSLAPNYASRVALDRALTHELARQRTVRLESEAELALYTSLSVQEQARSRALADSSEATRREQARLAEEKRKAEEALKRAEEERLRQEAEAAGEQWNEPSLPESVRDLPPALTTRSATKPLAAGSYIFGSRWGAVGPWSRYHTGQDLSAPVGTTVRSVADGVVVSPNAGSWAGIHVIVQHSDGSSTLYAHLNSAGVRPGQLVGAGQPIGIVGMTGRTFGPHLHFEHYPAGKATSNPYVTDDPYVWLLRLGVRL